MKISTRGEYGLRVLMELGMERDRGLSLREIAERQRISLDYLEQIVPALKSAGLIKARRGAHGGYYLAKPPAEITIYDALIALEGPFDLMLCVSDADPLGDSRSHTDINGELASGCLASGSCAVQEVWQEMKKAVESVLVNLTLAELLSRQQRRFGVPIRTYSEKEIMKLTVLN